jgi:hypothetical protein
MTKTDTKSIARAALYAQDNVHDMLHVLCDKFDLQKKINPLTQGMIAEQLIKGLTLIDPDVKE